MVAVVAVVGNEFMAIRSEPNARAARRECVSASVCVCLLRWREDVCVVFVSQCSGWWLG